MIGTYCVEVQDWGRAPAPFGQTLVFKASPDSCGCAGRRYRDDPTIFGWDLINEPRCNCFPSKLPPPSEWDTLEGACSPKCADKITVSPFCCC